MSEIHPVIRFLGKVGRYTTDVLAPPSAGGAVYEWSNHNPYLALISGALTVAVVLVNELYFGKRLNNSVV